MDIIQFEPKDRRNRRKFINFPFRLYKNDPNWVPPLRMDMRRIFNRKKYGFYSYGKAAFFLALDDQGEPLGRIALINNQRYNTFHNTKTAFFYYFETVKDPQVSAALFARGMAWARSQGLTHLLGPKGMTVLDGFGMLVKGFNYRPAFGQPYNPNYYPELMQGMGFSKVKDIFTGWIDRNSRFSEKILTAARIVERKMGFHVPRLTKKSELRQVIADFQSLYNESLAEPAGNPPLTDEDMNTMTSQLLWIADPRLVKIIYKEGKPIGWMLAYPDIGAALQRIRGRLFPFGWLQLLIEPRRTHWIDFNGIGIIEDYQRMGGTAVLFKEIFNSIQENPQYQYGELLQMREENLNILLETKNIGITFHKTHRLYEKDLSS